MFASMFFSVSSSRAEVASSSNKTGLPLVEAYLFVNLADLIKMVIGIVLLRRGIWVRNIVTGEEIAAGNAAG